MIHWLPFGFHGSGAFGIQVFLQVFGGVTQGRAIRWNVGFGDPEDCVEYDFELIWIAPVSVRMPPRETEAAASIRTFIRPHHRFLAAARRLDVIVGAGRINILSLPD